MAAICLYLLFLRSVLFVTALGMLFLLLFLLVFCWPRVCMANSRCLYDLRFVSAIPAALFAVDEEEQKEF
jgi:hypothetical protein